MINISNVHHIVLERAHSLKCIKTSLVFKKFQIIQGIFR